MKRNWHFRIFKFLQKSLVFNLNGAGPLKIIIPPTWSSSVGAIKNQDGRQLATEGNPSRLVPVSACRWQLPDLSLNQRSGHHYQLWSRPGDHLRNCSSV